VGRVLLGRTALPGVDGCEVTLALPWSWWRILLPLWAVLWHNGVQVAVGFIWLTWMGWLLVAAGQRGPRRHWSVAVSGPRRRYHTGANWLGKEQSSPSPTSVSPPAREAGK
jgi:hypothetical protein